MNTESSRPRRARIKNRTAFEMLIILMGYLGIGGGLMWWAFLNHEEPPLVALAAVVVAIVMLFDDHKDERAGVSGARRTVRARALELWRNYVADETQAMRVVIAVACTLTTSLIGYVYAREIVVRGWQLGAWVICVVTIIIALMPPERPSFRITKLEIGALGLMLAALLLRVTFLEQAPGGLHVDEVGAADFALRQVFPDSELTANPFRTGPASQPTLFFYLQRLALALVGNSITGLRITSALAGALAILATYGTVAILQDRRTALIAATIMTTYHYHIHWSRLGLNNIWDTLWIPLMLLAFTWGWKNRWSGGAVLAGLALGLSQYFYHGSKVGGFLLAFLIWWLWRQERDIDRLVVQVGKLALTAICVASPIVIFALLDPVPYFERASVVFAWSPTNIGIETRGTFDLVGYAWRQIWNSVGAFVAVPDVTGFYGPGVPFVIGVAAILFVTGLLWAIFKRHWVPALWILLTVVLGGFLVTGAPSSSHYVASIPAICWL
ncbi:MAG: glycosyltransferase family 39 protein, partial [Chloroflexota bacterium]